MESRKSPAPNCVAGYPSPANRFGMTAKAKAEKKTKEISFVRCGGLRMTSREKRKEDSPRQTASREIPHLRTGSGCRQRRGQKRKRKKYPSSAAADSG